MIIRNEKDRIKLAEEIKSELGIDINKYRTEEVAETIFDLLSFPQYIFAYTIRPILYSVGAFIIGYFLINLVHIEYVLYTLIGLPLFLGVGILLGVNFFVGKIKGDMFDVIKYSIEIFNNIKEDLKLSKANLSAERKRYQYNLLFQGVVHHITLPVITEVVADKIPIVGGFIKSLIYRVMSGITNIFAVDKPNTELKQELDKRGEASILEQESASFERLSAVLDKTILAVFAAARFPLKIMLGILSLLLLLFVYLIN